MLCRPGEKSTIFFTSDIGFGDNQVGPLPPWTPLAYDVEVIALNGKGIESEQNIIKSLNLEGFTLHPSGMYYRYLVDSSTVRPLANSIVYGWYSISLTDGTPVTQTSGANEKINLSSQMPEAIRLGFQLASLGGRVSIVAPSPLGYGKKGSTG
jgi:FKBP-type peptidyl-prolyl cis-trans isomerase